MSPCMFLGLFAVYLLEAASAVNTNNVPYDRMLPLTAVDAYTPCMRARRDTYCFVSARLIGEASNPLYNALVEHSANNLTHFDRTIVHRGICVKKTCKKFLKISPNLTIALEGCLNNTLSKDYGLTARVESVLCNKYTKNVQLDASDYGFGAVLLVLLGLNLLGSVYDFYGKGEDTIFGRSLLCFSVRRNWQKLMASKSGDPGQSQLLGLSRVRVILAWIVTVAHTGMAVFQAAENIDYIEESYHNPLFMVWYRCLELLQVTYVMSAMLLSYNVLKSEDQATYKNAHKALLHRWLRFTPTYAFMLFFISTWARHVSEGPFWKVTIESESNDCRRNWWSHLLYINNYVDNSKCMLHSWSLAVEMQLAVMGTLILFVLKGERARKAAIALLLAVGMLAPAATIFFNNLRPVFISSPEVARNWYVHDPTFNYLYKRGHTNLVCYGLGLILGYMVYNLKESDVGAEKYKKFHVVHRFLLPGILVVQLTSSIFFDPELTVPLPVRLFYTSTIKLLTGLFMSSHIFLIIVRAGNFSRCRDVGTKVFRWRIWTTLARLTFCVYMVHLILIRIRVGASETVLYLSIYNFIRDSSINVAGSFLLALPLFLMVEAPFGQLTRLLFAPRQKKRED